MFAKAESLKGMSLFFISSIFKQFEGFEQIKSFIIAEEPFSLENELITPTQKKRRALIQKKYQAKLEELYKK